MTHMASTQLVHPVWMSLDIKKKSAHENCLLIRLDRAPFWSQAVALVPLGRFVVVMSKAGSAVGLDQRLQLAVCHLEAFKP